MTVTIDSNGGAADDAADQLEDAADTLEDTADKLDDVAGKLEDAADKLADAADDLADAADDNGSPDMSAEILAELRGMREDLTAMRGEMAALAAAEIAEVIDDVTDVGPEDVDGIGDLDEITVVEPPPGAATVEDERGPNRSRWARLWNGST
jgi:methyl-accepting chemotaxis protein